MADARRQAKGRRRYAPRVEALEALRLLEAAPGVAPLVLSHELPGTLEPPGGVLGLAPALEGIAPAAEVLADVDTWDAALRVADPAEWFVESGYLAEGEAVEQGLGQLDRYLARAWIRSGVGRQQFDDCTQAVHATMLQHLGREGFDRMLAAVGRDGVPRVLNRETAIGVDFFRAVDMVKKRAQRQRSHMALEDRPDLAAPTGGDGASSDWRGALHEAIDRSLEPREAELIRATLDGFTPAEIASRWGLAPKTVSNEKTRALAKLREALVAEVEL